jgi:hypothetical protein
VNVPGFIVRQFYVAGSLRSTDDGWQFQAHNPMGDGTLVGIGRMTVDGTEIAAEAVTARRPGDAAPIRASDISRFNPVRVVRGDSVTLHVAGKPLSPGEHRLEVELHEIDLGRLTLAITDRVA